MAKPPKDFTSAVNLMSVPRPAMLVAMVTIPFTPASATISASRACNLAFNKLCIKQNVLNAKLHAREAEIVADAGVKGMVTIATNMAGRGTDIKLTAEVKALGGLAIIGTER